MDAWTLTRPGARTPGRLGVSTPGRLDGWTLGRLDARRPQATGHRPRDKTQAAGHRRRPRPTGQRPRAIDRLQQARPDQADSLDSQIAQTSLSAQGVRAAQAGRAGWSPCQAAAAKLQVGTSALPIVCTYLGASPMPPALVFQIKKNSRHIVCAHVENQEFHHWLLRLVV